MNSEEMQAAWGEHPPVDADDLWTCRAVRAGETACRCRATVMVRRTVRTVPPPELWLCDRHAARYANRDGYRLQELPGG